MEIKKMDEIKNRENLRKEMIDAHKPPNKIDALQTTHKIAKLQDFIKFAENTLKMSD
ncbi:MAG: hypothetical protein P8X78_03485 [Nitrosopumilaceae archaeon]